MEGSQTFFFDFFYFYFYFGFFFKFSKAVLKDAPAARTLVFEDSGWGPPPLLRIFYFLPPPPPLLISPAHVLGTPATQLRQYLFLFFLYLLFSSPPAPFSFLQLMFLAILPRTFSAVSVCTFVRSSSGVSFCTFVFFLGVGICTFVLISATHVLGTPATTPPQLSVFVLLY